MASSEEQLQPKPRLSPDDYATNAFRAMVKGIPYLGGSLDQFLFGPLQELRMRRIETTLHEIAGMLQQKNIPPSALQTEDFANLLEYVVPRLSRSANENKRERFRDLLLNAALTPQGDPCWEDARLASKLLDEIDPPGLAILAALRGTDPRNAFDVVSAPTPQVFEGRFDFGNPGGPHHLLPYEWPVIEEWMHCLREKRLISYSSSSARGGFGSVVLNDLGKLLVRWTLRDES